MHVLSFMCMCYCILLQLWCFCVLISYISYTARNIMIFYFVMFPPWCIEFPYKQLFWDCILLCSCAIWKLLDPLAKNMNSGRPYDIFASCLLIGGSFTCHFTASHPELRSMCVCFSASCSHQAESHRPPVATQLHSPQPEVSAFSRIKSPFESLLSANLCNEMQ